MKIRSGPFKGKELIIAEQDVVDRHPDIVDEILECIGIKEALVTDLSELSDFGEHHLERVNRHFGLELATAYISFPVLIDLIEKRRKPPQ
jgi:hypothetical protein